jgi:pyruvate dehydrogenase E2 component (dihydrolipoamide acetyltransferase)
MIVAGTVIAVLGEPGKKASDATAAVRLGPLPAGVNASHLVQNIANKEGIDLSRVKGTGSGGRITKKDLETFLESGMESPLAAASTAAAVEPAATGAAAAPGTYLSENQKMIGRNLQVSKAKIPHYYLKISILSDSLLSWRQANILPDGSRVSINAILIYAAARALKRFPRLNACFRESQMQLNPEINVGLAVSAGEDLYVPVVRGAGEKGIQEIDQELKWLVAKAQNGRLEPEDLNGGTFTVSNLGMYPVDEFCAIISPPQVAILAFGRIRKEVVVDAQGAIQIRSTCVATGSFDHRIVNGAQGAAFLAEVKKIVEEEL